MKDTIILIWFKKKCFDGVSRGLMGYIPVILPVLWASLYASFPNQPESFYVEMQRTQLKRGVEYAVSDGAKWQRVDPVEQTVYKWMAL